MSDQEAAMSEDDHDDYDREAARLAFGGLPMGRVRGRDCTDDCPPGFHRHGHPEAEHV